MDRQLSSQFIQKKKRRMLLTGTLVAGGVFILIAAFRWLIVPVVHLSEADVVTVSRGDIEASVSATGIILPEFEEVIVSPVTSRITKVYHNAGERVARGALILTLDKTADELTLSKMNEELASRQNQRNRLQLTIESALTELRTNYEIQRLKMESIQQNFENEKYIKTLGGTTEEMVKQAELQSRIARLEIDHLGQTIINKKASLETDLKEQDYRISIFRKEMQEVVTRLQDSDVKAPGDGVITWVNDKIGSTVTSGSDLVKLANLSSFKIECLISEMHSRKLALQGKAIIVINDSLLTGTITSVNPTVQNDAVKFTVMPGNKSHPALSSNKKIDVMVVTSHRKSVIRLPQTALRFSGASPYFFVIEGDKAVRRQVKLGEGNFEFIEVESGLKPGDKVIVSDMRDKMHLNSIKIKP